MTQIYAWTTAVAQFFVSGQWLSAYLAILIIILHATAYATIASGFLRITFADFPARFSVLGGIGLTALGFQMWIMGYLRLWNQQAVMGSSVISIAIVVTSFIRWWRRSRKDRESSSPEQDSTALIVTTVASSPWQSAALADFVSLCDFSKAKLVQSTRGFGSGFGSFEFMLCTGVLMMVLVAILGAIQPPYVTDEVGYHWAAPLAWAEAGHWIQVPFRYMNSACLAELLYLISALFHSHTGAHWTHALFFLILATSCATLTRFCGGSGLVVFAACCSTPVIFNQVAYSYSDITAASLALAGLVAILRTAVTNSADLRNALLGAGFLLMGVYSVKPALAPAIAASYVAAIGCRNFKIGHPIKSSSITFAFALLLMLTLWTIHTEKLTGKFFDSTGVVLLPADQNLRDHQEAVAKIPSVRSLILLPMLPILTPVLGQQEPYGGRTGLVILPFTLLLILLWRKIPIINRKNCVILFGAFVTNFLLVGAFTVRTRYLNYSWALLLCLSALGLQMGRIYLPSKLKPFIMIFFLICIFISMIDSVHIILHWHDKELPGILPKFLIPE